MSQLTTQQVNVCAAQVANHIFGNTPSPLSGATYAKATVTWQDLEAAVSALDAAFDTTLATAATQQPNTDTIVQYLAAQIPSPASAGTAQQKTILACYVLLKRAGLV